MLIIDPTLIGRKFYTTDQKTTYTVRGVAIMGTLLVLGEYDDAQFGCTRLATHKMADCKFLPAGGVGSALPT